MIISVSAENQITLEAAKDTFGRSNERNLNNGASPHLVLAHSPGIRSLVAFDLSSVTNEITAVEFKFRQHNTLDVPLSLVVAPMVWNENNAAWIEGSGALGVKGRNALLGEATFAWRAFRDMPWESTSGAAKLGLMENNLWQKPIAIRTGLQWIENTWVSVPVENAANAEDIRKSDAKVLTYGLWGTAGKGAYLVSSKESGYAPKLILTLKSE